MREKIFELKRKGILFVFLAVISILFTFGIKTEQAQACKVTCRKVSLGVVDPALNCSYGSAFIFGSDTACVVSSGVMNDLCSPLCWAGTFDTNPCVNTGGDSKEACSENACPSAGTLVSGTPCKVFYAMGATCTGTVQGAGVWDSSRNQCVECSGNMGKVWGDASQTYAAPASVCKEICGGPAANDGDPACPAGCTPSASACSS